MAVSMSNGDEFEQTGSIYDSLYIYTWNPDDPEEPGLMSLYSTWYNEEMPDGLNPGDVIAVQTGDGEPVDIQSTPTVAFYR